MKFRICVLLFLVFIVGLIAVPDVSSVQGQSSSVMKLQILLDRAGYSPGEIDGRMGTNVEKAIGVFQEISGIPVSGRPDDDTMAALGDTELDSLLVDYTVTSEDVAGPFVKNIPKDPMEQARLPRLGYTSVLEGLAEKFHSSPDLLRQINPRAEFQEGETIRVPNLQRVDPEVSRPILSPVRNASNPESRNEYPIVVVTQETSNVILRGANNEVLFYAPATVGSERDPLPVGEWKVTVIRKAPVFYYSPELFWDAEPEHSKTKIAAGPNNPVGLVWIGVNAPHYGLHGCPEPAEIGHSASHGCVRMTNWDALRLASLIRPGTKVIFQ